MLMNGCKSNSIGYSEYIKTKVFRSPLKSDTLKVVIPFRNCVLFNGLPTPANFFRVAPDAA